MIGFWIGVIGIWIIADAVASLYTYTASDRAQTQSWLRDHSMRILRGIFGLILLFLGYLIQMGYK